MVRESLAPGKASRWLPRAPKRSCAAFTSAACELDTTERASSHEKQESRQAVRLPSPARTPGRLPLRRSWPWTNSYARVPSINGQPIKPQPLALQQYGVPHGIGIWSFNPTSGSRPYAAADGLPSHAPSRWRNVRYGIHTCSIAFANGSH